MQRRGAISRSDGCGEEGADSSGREGDAAVFSSRLGPAADCQGTGSPETVRKSLPQGSWQPYGKPCRSSVLDGQKKWLRQRFLVHRGNADVVRQELDS